MAKSTWHLSKTHSLSREIVRMQDSSNSYVGTSSLSQERDCSANHKFFQDVEAVSYIKMVCISPRFAILNTIVYMMSGTNDFAGYNVRLMWHSSVNLFNLAASTSSLTRHREILLSMTNLQFKRNFWSSLSLHSTCLTKSKYYRYTLEDCKQFVLKHN
jgi:hypothetical protein